ncbi:F-box/LRR-repeat protein 2 [Galendromus occidentalis]|uniref:F-box/LRR-repeat protein 2 n=1 Tax=Galendromus occidentalis TaxID=34638 RepID=A0AAJ6QYJ7_9ACAR|nr:F-box/LRR-repeat protein 2 [Galendromus occidentalis]
MSPMIEMGEHRQGRKRSVSPTPETELRSHPLSNGYTNHVLDPTIAPVAENLINKMLPKELLLKVFSFLDIVTLCRCAQVSREWNLLAMDGSNWQNIDLFSYQKDINCDVVSYIAGRCGRFLTVISLRGCEDISGEALIQFSEHCPNIEKVVLSCCRKITDDAIVALAKACRRLHSLYIDSCVELTDRSIMSFKNLRDVNISWCRKITQEGIGMLGSEHLVRFTAKGCAGVTNEAMSRLASSSPKLEALDLQCCPYVFDAAIIAVAQNCHELRNLCASGCSNLTDASTQALAQGCPKLHTLEMASCNRCGDAGFVPLVKACHELRRLDLEECVLITDSTLNSIALSCPFMDSLSLSHCDQITDQGVLKLSQNLLRLTVIELDNCPFISDITLDCLVDCFPALQRVELYDCQLITQESIKKFKERRPGLRLHTYFAPTTPQQTEPPGGVRQRYCRCCVIV